MESSASFTDLSSVKALLHNYEERLSNTHIRHLLADDERNNSLVVEHDGIVLDFTHTKIDQELMKCLSAVAEEANLKSKIESMFNGTKINLTEKRSVLHVALRMSKEQKLDVDGEGDVVKAVWEVRDKIQKFSEKVRSGDFKGFTGKDLKNVIVIGIGGSYLGPEFVYEALRYDPDCYEAAKGRALRFLANVDPTDFYRALEGLDLEETLFIINSKTFTTAETMLNARTCAAKIVKHYREAFPDTNESDFIAHHVVAGSTNIEATKKFGIDEDNVFGFWDWVGGRYSVCSAIGVLPLSIHQIIFSTLKSQ